MSAIKLVRGDSLPQLLVAIEDDSSDPDAPKAINVTGATPRLYFRREGETELLATLVGTVFNGPAGQVLFDWGPTTLDVPAGDYEGEVELTYVGGQKQTVWRLLKFIIREQVG